VLATGSSIASAGTSAFDGVQGGGQLDAVRPELGGELEPLLDARSGSGSRFSRGVSSCSAAVSTPTFMNFGSNAATVGADYRHQNDGYLGGGDAAGEAVRPHDARGPPRWTIAGASMIVTVPMAGAATAGRVRRQGPGRRREPDPGLPERARFLESRAAKRGGFSYPPDAGDRVVFQDEFVAWLESAFPDARRDPARTLFYSLDNEPDLWASTHPRSAPPAS
jgi:hypothetical protein